MESAWCSVLWRVSARRGVLHHWSRGSFVRRAYMELDFRRLCDSRIILPGAVLTALFGNLMRRFSTLSAR